MTAEAKNNQTGRLWVEEGEVKIGLVANVAPVAPIDKLYTFTVPDELAGQLRPGQRVNVPFGRMGRLAVGFCVDVHRGEWTSTLRPIDSLVDLQSHLTPELLELGRWMAHHYACPPGRTFGAMVPQAVRSQSGFRTVRYARLTRPPETIAEQGRCLGPKQKAVLTALADADQPVEVKQLLSATTSSSATLRAMAARGWVEITQRKEPPPPPDFDRPPEEPGFELNADQQTALTRIARIIDDGGFRVALLYGVSGSGKTEVYVRAMRRVVEAGRQVILLVPEIALTTQLVHRLACRFRDVAVIHSGLTGVARSLTWEAITAGRKKVIIGTRSAIFAPCCDLGLLVVDEEQETSYKNLQAPRFHVRDVAIKRAQLASIPIVLGSATPSLESWINCDRLPHFERMRLPHRVRGLPMPRVHVVDMRDEYRLCGGLVLLSRRMEQALAAVLDRGEQAVLLINRRGYASAIFCPECRHRLVCPSCQAALVFHSAAGQAICHYCRHRVEVPTSCPNPSCRARLVLFGAGTQRVEAVLKKRFPTARIARADSDTMTRAARYRELIHDLEARKIDVVVGTQMVAKGLDFPFVSFVGVLNADVALTAPDFRAAERLFQLITQVAGRAGRGDVPGEVVVQSMDLDLPALQAAMQHDYERFARAELEIRRRVRFPPYTRLTRLVLAGENEGDVRREADAQADRIREAIEAIALEEADVLGPQPCVLARLRNQYRFDLVIRAATPEAMQTLLDHLRTHKLLNPRVKTLVVDVDPVSLA